MTMFLQTIWYAEPPAKTAWGNARDGAVNVGRTVKGFFTNLFSN